VEGGDFFMIPCNRMYSWSLYAAGGAFLIAALIGSFWISFTLGALLILLGFFIYR
jgi:hypothetical protein